MLTHSPNHRPISDLDLGGRAHRPADLSMLILFKFERDQLFLLQTSFLIMPAVPCNAQRPME